MYVLINSFQRNSIFHGRKYLSYVTFQFSSCYRVIGQLKLRAVTKLPN